jgi:hypothetical protein
MRATRKDQYGESGIYRASKINRKSYVSRISTLLRVCLTRDDRDLYA